MSFVSFEYAVLLLSTLAVYFFLPWRGRVVLLLAASYVFYCYWEPYYGYIIAFTTAVDYFAAIAIARSDSPRSRKTLLTASLVANLGALGYFKYTGFLLDTVEPALSLAGWDIVSPDIALPVGISFYTFQEMSYTIDVYWKRVRPTRDPLLFATYVSFFPQLVAGPIERADRLIPQLREKHRFDGAKLVSGAELVLIGLAKKLVVSDRLWIYGYPKFLDPRSFDAAELGLCIVLLPIALYLDFGAYTDIARGSARMFGIELSRNFFFPFAARDPGQFWQRWHITLADWLRDYVFEPLGGITPRSPMRTTLNLLFVTALLGLWHGAAWNFVLWGVANGLMLAVYFFVRVYVLRKRRIVKTAYWTAATYLTFTPAFLMLTALFFVPDVSTAVDYWSGLFSSDWSSLGDPSYAAASVFVVTFFAIQRIGSSVDYQAIWDRTWPPVKGFAYALLFYVVVFGSVPTARRFVYFQF